MLRNVCKTAVITSSALLVILLMIVTISYINHQVQLTKENEQFIPNGMMTEVNSHQMHVYKEGSGKEILVFLSGSGTSSPMLDFKSLYSLMSDTHQIAIVEKAGYGFSDVTDSARDLDTMLSETREALFQSGVEGPFILVPHSMSGIEALHWAQTYPDEVKAIIGLDMAVPGVYEQMNINIPFIRLGKLAADVGITRWLPSLAKSDAITYGTLTKDEKDLYKVIFYRRTATKNMVSEAVHIKDNAKRVQEGLPVNVPMLLFSSNGKGTGWNESEWIGFQQEFIADQEKGQLIELDCSHYVHDIEYKLIAKESMCFIEGL
ncbi:alpha/beta hydrolase [Sporosarcina sp. P13]|uniref:alpha/beta fold hydrolase n=1 Tax=Sporosarcina sp. P13 TaxID=2048263 RepID=UPI000C16B75A|nr:alpha/beta hydrolase [Sporosarcina sp. P13]PIC65040.1 alpha/beta hydrolase [Sporosarcina sp. P13]